MNKILFFIVLSLFVFIGKNEQKYIATNRYPNEHGTYKIAFSNDEKVSILYNNEDTKIYFHRTFDMKFLYDSDIPKPILYLQTFTNNAAQNSILFNDADGNIFLQDFTTNAASARTLLLALPDCKQMKAKPSPLSLNFLVICKDQTKVIIGDFSGKTKEIETQFTVEAASWHPLQNKIALAGTKIDDKSIRLIIQDIDTKDIKDYSTDLKTKINDLQFSEDGLLLAYVSSGNYLVSVLDIVNAKTLQLVAPDATELLEVRRSGKLLTSRDSNNAYAWQFNNNNYGKYLSTMKSSGLSRSAGFLYTIDSLKDNQIVQNSICPTDGQTFINSQLLCKPCQQPCVTCYNKAKQCSSCRDKYFFDEEKIDCNACKDNCKKCKDSVSCDDCADKYYPDGNDCKLCFDKFTGCQLCSPQKCTQCSEADNWILNGDKCQCKQKYVQVQKKCLACPAHCSRCSDITTCTKCDILQHRAITPVDGKCVCSDGYFQDIAQICQSCVLGCTKCDNTKTCTTCNQADHWILNAQKICQCDKPYTQVKNKCIICPVQCKTCLLDQTCQTCDETQHRTPAPIDGKCKCIEAYFEDLNFQCSPCIIGCKTCEDAQKCTECSAAGHFIIDDKSKQCICSLGYLLVKNQCLACPAHCSRCSDITTCTTCNIFQHRAITPVDGKCVCSDGYFQDIAQICQSCVLGCTKCDNVDTCIKCNEAYHWKINQKTNICECSQGYGREKSSCLTCSIMQGCLLCTDTNTCTSCEDAYNLNADTAKCDKKAQEGGLSTAVIIIIGVGVLIFLGVGSFFLVKVLRKRRQKKVRTLLESQAETENQLEH